MKREKVSAWVRFLAWIVRTSLGRYLRVRLKGFKPEHFEQPTLLASNHFSTLDPLLLCAYLIPLSGRIISPMATKGLFVRPLSYLLRAVGAVPVDRQNKRNLGSLRAVLRTLKRRSVLIFPEGGVSVGGLRAAKEGVGFIALKASVPVLPIAIIGTQRALPKGGRWIKRYPVEIRLGQPMSFDDKSSDQEVVARKIMREIKTLLDMDNRSSIGTDISV